MTVRNHGSLPPGVGASPLQADSWPHAGARHPGRLSLGTPDGDLDPGLGDIDPSDPPGEQRLVPDLVHTSSVGD
jgi:hypothetical protein